MRVMVVAPPWLRIPPEGYGGIELVVGVLVDQLVARGHDVTLVASGGSTSTGRVRSPLGEPPPPAVLGDAWVEGTHALSAYREAAGLDVIHDHGGVFGPALASRSARHNAGTTLRWTTPGRSTTGSTCRSIAWRKRKTGARSSCTSAAPTLARTLTAPYASPARRVDPEAARATRSRVLAPARRTVARA
jgi:hypothetical protein